MCIRDSYCFGDELNDLGMIKDNYGIAMGNAVEEVKKAITEGTNGRAGLEKDAELYFAKVNGEVKTFEK